MYVRTYVSICVYKYICKYMISYVIHSFAQASSRSLPHNHLNPHPQPTVFTISYSPQPKRPKACQQSKRRRQRLGPLSTKISIPAERATHEMHGTQQHQQHPPSIILCLATGLDWLRLCTHTLTRIHTDTCSTSCDGLCRRAWL